MPVLARSSPRRSPRSAWWWRQRRQKGVDRRIDEGANVVLGHLVVEQLTGQAGGQREDQTGQVLVVDRHIVLALTITAWNIGSWHWDTMPGWLAFTLLVAFVEETFFRGIVLRMLLPYGWVTAWVLSSVVFGLGHAINLVVGHQTPFTTLVQVCFALAWGLFTAAAYARTGSIWPVFIFHALFDAMQLAGVHQTTTPVDMTTLAVMLTAAMVIGLRMRTSFKSTSTPN
jgi:hypothetical protein